MNCGHIFVAAVEQTATPSGKGSLVRGFIDHPKLGMQIEGAGCLMIGWTLGLESPADGVELVRGGDVFRRLQLDQERPDLVAGFPEDPNAGRSGFRALLPTFGLDGVDIEARAVLKDGRRARIGLLRLERAKGPSGRLVSIIIPCFNQGHYLPEAIESALSQTYGALEVVVVDDGSSDNTSEITRRYPGVLLLRQENRGLAAARNAGLSATHGEYVVFLDADDRLRPEAVTSGLRMLDDNPSSAIACGRFRYIDEQGKPLFVAWRPSPGRSHFGALLHGNFCGAPGALVHRRSVLEEVGRFDETLAAAEDYDLYLRITRSHPLCLHGEVVADYRRHGAAMTRNPIRMLSSTVSVLKRQRRIARRAGLMQDYRDGLRFWRRYYGEPLVDWLRAARTRGSTKDLRLGVRTLVRHHPSTLARLALGRQPRWASPAAKSRSAGRRARRRFSAGIVLLYHDVGEAGVGSDLAITPQRFEEHLDALTDAYQVTATQSFTSGRLDGHSGRAPVAITFDGGYASTLYSVKPLLDRRDAPATVFVTSGFVGSAQRFWWDEAAVLLLGPHALPDRVTIDFPGKTYEWTLHDDAQAVVNEVCKVLGSLGQVDRDGALQQLREQIGCDLPLDESRPLTWDEVERLVDGGLLEIGAHTVTHPRLSARPLREQESEVLESKRSLEQALSRTVTSFSYPFGSQEDFSEDTVRIVERVGFEQAFSTVTHSSAPPDRYLMPRLWVGDWDGDELVRHIHNTLAGS